MSFLFNSTKVDIFFYYIKIGENMKTYYIFNIKEEFVSLYKDSPSTLFLILKNIYYLDKTEVDYGYNLFRQLVLPFQKNEIDKELFIKYHKSIPYSKRKETHIINNLYRNEISRLKINNYFMKLEIEQNFSTFFELFQNNKSLFACSFQKTDFFFLNDYSTKQLV